MDQRQTTTSMLDAELFPGVSLASLLGQLLRGPVRDIPTVETLEREQGQVGVPTEAQSSRQLGQDVLDWLAQAANIAGIMRAPTRRPGNRYPSDWTANDQGDVAAEPWMRELMGKQRGIETFGKEMMDTIRRAQPQRWRQMEQENFPMADDPAMPIMQGRESFRDLVRYRSPMPPEEASAAANPYTLRYREGPTPADAVRMERYAGGDASYRIGQGISLPGRDGIAYFRVDPHGGNYRLELVQTGGAGTRTNLFGVYPSIGEATAVGRKLALRMELAAKDLQAQGWYGPEGGRGYRQVGARRIRLPWESGIGSARDPDVPGVRTSVPGMWRDIPLLPGE